MEASLMKQCGCLLTRLVHKLFNKKGLCSLPHLYPDPTYPLLLFLAVIAKVFRQADTEETGHVDSSFIFDLAVSVLGASVKEAERSLIKYHLDSRAG